jgi:hypothetical protein
VKENVRRKATSYRYVGCRKWRVVRILSRSIYPLELGVISLQEWEYFYAFPSNLLGSKFVPFHIHKC